MRNLKWEQEKSGTAYYLIVVTQHKMMIVAAPWVLETKLSAGTANAIHTTGYLKAWKCKRNSSCPCVCLCNVYSVWSSSIEMKIALRLHLSSSLTTSKLWKEVVSFRPLSQSWCSHFNKALALFRTLLGSNIQRKGEDVFLAMFSAGIYCLPSGTGRGKPEQKL